MELVGYYKGTPIAIQRGLLKSTIYAGKRRRSGGTAFLGDLGLGPDFTSNPYDISGSTLNTLQTGGDGGFDWSSIFTAINPIMQGVGARISGGNPYPGQANPYLISPIPTASASVSPLLLVGGLGLAAIMLMKK